MLKVGFSPKYEDCFRNVTHYINMLKEKNIWLSDYIQKSI